MGLIADSTSYSRRTAVSPPFGLVMILAVPDAMIHKLTPTLGSPSPRRRLRSGRRARGWLLGITLCSLSCESVEPDLAIITTDVVRGFVGSAYLGILRAAGGAQPYEWETVQGEVPGLTLAPNGQLVGVPSQGGGWPITVRVRSGDRYGTRELKVLIYSNPLRIVNDSLPTATLGTLYNVQLRHNGQGASPGGRFGYSIISGSLPPGLGFWSESSIFPTYIQGTPASLGSFSFRLRLMRGPAEPVDTTERSYTLTVVNR